MLNNVAKYFALFCMLSIYNTEAYGEVQWIKFMQKVDESSLCILKQELKDCGKKCSKETLPSESIAYELFELIQKGDLIATHAVLLVSNCLDGMLLEDFYRSMGVFFEKKPIEFLYLAKNNKIADLEIKYALIMLPLDTVDHYELQLDVINKRMQILWAIKNDSLKKIIKKGIWFLKENKKVRENKGGVIER